MVKDKVLFIDDERVLWDLVRTILETGGFAVIYAGDGQSGIDHAVAENPAVIILDVMMPKMDGYETCRHLKEDPRTQEIPVVLLTASQDRHLSEKAFACGADLCLTKPFRPERLLNTIHLALKKRRPVRRKAAEPVPSI